jgi:hypothetical protein
MKPVVVSYAKYETHISSLVVTIRKKGDIEGVLIDKVITTQVFMGYKIVLGWSCTREIYSIME